MSRAKHALDQVEGHRTKRVRHSSSPPAVGAIPAPRVMTSDKQGDLAAQIEDWMDVGCQQAINGLSTDQIKGLLFELATSHVSVMKKVLDLRKATTDPLSARDVDQRSGTMHWTQLDELENPHFQQNTRRSHVVQSVRDVGGSRQSETDSYPGRDEREREARSGQFEVSARFQIDWTNDEDEYFHHIECCKQVLNKHYREFDEGDTSDYNEVEQMWATLKAHVAFAQRSVSRRSTMNNKDMALAVVCEIAMAVLAKFEGAIGADIERRLVNGSQYEFIEDAIERIISLYTEDEIANPDAMDLGLGYETLRLLTDESLASGLMNDERLRRFLYMFQCRR